MFKYTIKIQGVLKSDDLKIEVFAKNENEAMKKANKAVNFKYCRIIEISEQLEIAKPKI